MSTPFLSIQSRLFIDQMTQNSLPDVWKVSASIELNNTAGMNTNRLSLSDDRDRSIHTKSWHMLGKRARERHNYWHERRDRIPLSSIVYLCELRKGRKARSFFFIIYLDGLKLIFDYDKCSLLVLYTHLSSILKKAIGLLNEWVSEESERKLPIVRFFSLPWRNSTKCLFSSVSWCCNSICNDHRKSVRWHVIKYSIYWSDLSVITSDD